MIQFTSILDRLLHGWLPRLAGPEDYTSAAGSGAEGERLLGKRVLLVEDQALLAMELQFALEDEGAEVLGPALSLSAAVRMVNEAKEIDAAVLDVDLSGEDVYPVAA